MELAPLTVIVGRRGSGVSSLLDAAAVARMVERGAPLAWVLRLVGRARSVRRYSRLVSGKRSLILLRSDSVLGVDELRVELRPCASPGHASWVRVLASCVECTAGAGAPRLYHALLEALAESMASDPPRDLGPLVYRVLLSHGYTPGYARQAAARVSRVLDRLALLDALEALRARLGSAVGCLYARAYMRTPWYTEEQEVVLGGGAVAEYLAALAYHALEAAGLAAQGGEYRVRCVDSCWVDAGEWSDAPLAAYITPVTGRNGDALEAAYRALRSWGGGA